ncbi:hypothetical protein [Spiroplasma litorale]|nr:hypothetical protein [Spiroplasma litorale]
MIAPTSLTTISCGDNNKTSNSKDERQLLILSGDYKMIRPMRWYWYI